MHWLPFLGALFLAYLTVNTLFALAYYTLGTEQLQGAEAPTAWGRFLYTFFFSAHTLTTVDTGASRRRGWGRTCWRRSNRW